MSYSSRWFDRQFDFSFSVDLLPNVCARLRGTAARLEEVLSKCDPLRVIEKPQGKWSAQEHAGHMLDLEGLWLARVEDYFTASGELTPTDLQNRRTDEAKHNERALEEILSGFRAARGKLLERVEGLEQSAFERTLPHPRMRTPMRLIDHLYFVAEHDDHHLAAIWDLTQKPAK